MVDFERFLPHSPPVFSHSPPASFLEDYLARSPYPRLPQRTAPTSCRQDSFSMHTKPNFRNLGSPKRPILVIRASEEDAFSQDSSDPTSPTKLKKKVVFADDKGMSLTHVRVMTEPSNVPPLWSTKFLAEVTKGVNADPEVQQEPWEISFAQPASDYITFRNKLEEQHVCLENVIVKEPDEQIVGTIKVKNLSFHKEVFIRFTTNSWKNYEDSFCTYIPSNILSGTTVVLYDTFSFKINLPPKARKLEFCVGYRCDVKEFWDNNSGKNYVILKKSVIPLHRSLSDTNFNNHRNTNQRLIQNNYSHSKIEDIVKLDSWSQFASWNHLENSAPYCFY